MPTIYGIDHVQLAMPAGEERAAIAFYQDMLGMPQLPKPPELQGRGGAWFACGNLQIHLGVEVNFSPAKKAHPALLVKDLPALLQRLQAAGIAVNTGDQISTCYRAFIHDPFGNRIELMEPYTSQEAAR